MPNNATTRLPVVVFLPGGNFRQGAASTLIYDARRWVRNTPHIMVTTNYRLGALGWLIQDDVPRNLGIKDQRLALQWVVSSCLFCFFFGFSVLNFAKQATNIAAFGGDPSQIVLMGQSAGATSIGYHMLSSKSAGFVFEIDCCFFVI